MKTSKEAKTILVHIAMSSHPYAKKTQKETAVELRAAGLPGNKANLQRVKVLKENALYIRCNRELHNVNRRLGITLNELPDPTGRPPIILPKGEPLDRLNRWRKEIIVGYAKQTLRHGAPGGTWFNIKFAETTRHVDYSTSVSKIYENPDRYNRHWSKNYDAHEICVPKDWRLRVQKRGLAILGGMLTLDAIPMISPHGIELYAAVWVTQSRGYSVKVYRGYIALAFNESFHGETVEIAISGLKNKCKRLQNLFGNLEDIKAPVDLFVEKYSGIEINVSLEDARASGNCEYGIRSWCESVGIDTARMQIPMSELLSAFRRLPLIEVRRTAMYAVRQHRKVT